CRRTSRQARKCVRVHREKGRQSRRDRAWAGGSSVLPVRLAVAEDHRVDAVDLVETDIDALTGGRLDIAPAVIRANRHLALAAINQHGELNRGGTAEIA